MSSRQPTARQLVARTRSYLAVSVALSAVAWAVSAALIVEAMIVAIAVVTGNAVPESATVLRCAAAAAAAGAVLYRAWPCHSLERVALWVEEREPRLAFALVTATDPSLKKSPALERAAAFDPLALTRRPIARLVIIAVAALLVSLAISYAITGPRAASDIVAGRGVAPGLLPAAVSNPLESIRAVITPPAYSGIRSRTVDDPSAITGLPGSSVVVTGRGSGVAAFLGDAELRVARRREWRIHFEIQLAPIALTLRHDERQRVIVVEPEADAPPTVRLVSPPRDTIMQRATGAIRVAAAVEDDLGISDGYIEYMVSSGADETFTARTVVAGGRDFRGSARGDLTATLDLDALRLGPGDLVSIRAVARDANDVTGRGVGVSDTRTYRVARRDEYDSLAIEAGAPIVPESTIVSQRMLILRTEALLREQSTLARDSVLARVRAIAADQIRLRERVHDIIYPAHTHAEGEVEAGGEPEDVAERGGPVNPNLKTAYEKMWSASRELQIAQPAPALPLMRAAAAALDRARLANRYYLRSGVSRVVVDVPLARLTGTDKGSSSTRAPHAADTVRQRLAREFAQAAAIRNRERAADELALLRVRALAEFPELAEALRPAIEALRQGRDAEGPLAAARATFDRDALATRHHTSWSRW